MAPDGEFVGDSLIAVPEKARMTVLKGFLLYDAVIGRK